jgi:3-hydroxyacyl-[acyl-carrier-protein] dehydratase
MHFSLIDRVVEWRLAGAEGSSPARLVAIKLVSSAEEYLQDHFASFPVLPGVLMLEALVQAARELLEREAEASTVQSGTGDCPRMVLGRVRALKYGNFVPPGSTLRVEVERGKTLEGGHVEFKGVGTVMHPVMSQHDSGGAGAAGANGLGQPEAEAPVAVSGKFTLRPLSFVVTNKV